MSTSTPRQLRAARGGLWARIGSSTVYALALPLALLVTWGIWSSADPQAFFPGPARILEAFIDTWVGPAFIEDVVPSLSRLGLGLALSIALGIAAGTLIGSLRWLRDLSEPLLEFFRAIPPPAMIPIIVVLLGITDSMKVVVIVLGTVWPILLNTIDGVRGTDAIMKDTARSFALSRAERFRYLVLPAAMPRIMTGIRQAMSIALILMVISEMFYASAGLGFQIVYFQRNYLIAEMWSGIVLLGLVGVFMATVFGFVERRMLRWYHGVKEMEHG
jgi:ABC-type nitrate/sulfonate/bicarbonate transport system permease component